MTQIDKPAETEEVIAAVEPAPAEPVSDLVFVAPEVIEPAPEEVVAAVEPEPIVEPAVEVKPEEPKAPLTLVEIARQPKIWPASVVLSKDQEFNVMVEGEIFGTAEVKAGTPVKLLAVFNNGVNVEFNGVKKLVAVADTDLLRQFGHTENLAKVDASEAPKLN